MVLPIVAYGDPVLRKKGKEINKDYPKLDELIQNMWDTMYHAYGVGIAAPQVGLPIRLFVVDATPFAEDEELKEEGDEWAFNEGCLSIPDIREDVFRKSDITIEYLDENFEEHKDTFTGLSARVIQHEYDHIEGILFTDKLSSLKKRLIKGKLANIAKGKINVDYRMRFPEIKKAR